MAIATNDAREKRRASIAVGEERAWEFFPKMGDVRDLSRCFLSGSERALDHRGRSPRIDGQRS